MSSAPNALVVSLITSVLLLSPPVKCGKLDSWLFSIVVAFCSFFFFFFCSTRMLFLGFGGSVKLVFVLFEVEQENKMLSSSLLSVETK